MGSLSDSKYIIKTDGYWFVEAHDVDPSKGYISVSAKGIVNGLSNQPNDGADFGPDTYNPNYSGSGIPYTQTGGIQEAINYAFNKGGYGVRLLTGVYDVTNAPFQSDPNNSGAYGQIVIPLQLGSSNQKTINISIVGEGISRGGTEEGVSAGSFSGGVTIKSLATSSELYPSIIYAMRAPTGDGAGGTTLSNVNLWIDGLHIQGNPTSTNSVSGVDMTWIVSCNIGKIYIDTYYTGATAPYPPPSINSGKGIAWAANVDVSILQRAELIYVAGYAQGLVTTLTHAFVSQYISQFNAVGLTNAGTSSAYSGMIALFNVQYTSTHISINSTVNFTILQYDWGDEGTEIEGAFTYNVEIASGVTAWINIIAFNIATSTVSPTFSLTPNSILRVYQYMNKNGGRYVPTPSLTTNPPVSGTAYQNTNPYDIRIYLPAYATTSGTAGTVAIALGSTSSPTAIGTKFISGSTSSSSTEIIELVVPAGWYYEVTLTGTTLATASVFAV